MFLKSDKVLKTKCPALEFELLAPANNKEVAIGAINAGADAVYIGCSKYGARLQAGNSLEDIIEVIEYAHKYRVKIYITLNTILNDEELKDTENIIWKLYNAKADGIIIQDMGILECKIPPIPIIASTQCHNNTLEKIQFLEKTGFKRVILPREITLDEIRNISKNTNIQLECFIHGALCVSYSGQCYLSCSIGSRSANRGECAQPCRKKYSLKDADGNYILRSKYILSLKDLNLTQYLEDLILAGITSFKIEGRHKSLSYVANTTAFYRNAIDKILNNYGLKRSSQGKSIIDFEPDLYKSFNRGFTDFNITGSKKNIATINYNNSLGEFVGIVQKVKKDYFMLNSEILNNGDGICFFDEFKTLNGTNINKTDGKCVYPNSIKGIKEGTKIYRNYDKNFEDKMKNTHMVRKIPVKIKVSELEFGYLFMITDEENNTGIYLSEKSFEKALNVPKSVETIKVHLSKMGNTDYEVVSTNIKVKNVPFIKVARINEIRRSLIQQLNRIRSKNYKYNYRKRQFSVTEYPVKELDYRANILNKKAELFYKKRGALIKEFAYEAQPSKEKKYLMTSKYCIKNQLGICSKQIKINKYKEPYVLTDEFNKEYLVEFNCKDCVMKLSNL